MPLHHTQMNEGSPSPFGQQTMQEVQDRIQGFGSFITNFVSDALSQGVFVTSKRWCRDEPHQLFAKAKLLPIACKAGPHTLLTQTSFDRPTQSVMVNEEKIAKFNPRGGKIWASRERVSKFLASQFKAEKQGEKGYLTMGTKMAAPVITRSIMLLRRSLCTMCLMVRMVYIEERISLWMI